MAKARAKSHAGMTTITVALSALFAVSATLALAGDAKGTLIYKTRTANLKYAYLVKGPDAVSKQPIRRLILSATDLNSKITACRTMACTDSDLGEGLSLNLDIGSRLNYWMVMNDQKIQYSGTQKPEALSAKPNDDKRIAGTLRFDDTAAGGPKVDVEFDAPLVKELMAP
jgi:hypothetical protein